MTEREAIKQIEENIALIRDLDCTEYEMAIAALEKQVPKKPVDQMDNFGCTTLSCPICKNHVINYFNRHIKPPHCMMCGQKLEWDKEEGSEKKDE